MFRFRSGCGLRRQGGQDHVHKAALHGRGLLDGSGGLEGGGDAQEERAADLGVGDLAAAEEDGDLDLVAALEELLDEAGLEVDVVGADLGLEADLAEEGLLLVLVGVALLLGLLVLELAVVEEAADGGVGVGGDLDEVEAAVLGELEGLVEGEDAAFLALVVDEEDLADADAFVDAEIAGYGRPLAASRRWW